MSSPTDPEIEARFEAFCDPNTPEGSSESEPLSEAERDREFDRLIAEVPVDRLAAVALGRLQAHGLSRGDRFVLVELVAGLNRSALFDALGTALRDHPHPPYEVLWSALELLDRAERLEGLPDLAELWDEMRDALDVDPEDALVELLGEIDDTSDPDLGADLLHEALQAWDSTERERRLCSLAEDYGDHPAVEALVRRVRLESEGEGEGEREREESEVDVRDDLIDPGSSTTLIPVEVSQTEVLPVQRSGSGMAIDNEPVLTGWLGSIDGSGRAFFGLGVVESKGSALEVVAEVRAGGPEDPLTITGIRGVERPDANPATPWIEEIAAFGDFDLIRPISGPVIELLRDWLVMRAGSQNMPSLPDQDRDWIAWFRASNRSDQLARAAPSADVWIPLTERLAEPCPSIEVLRDASALILGSCPNWADDSEWTLSLARELVIRREAHASVPLRDEGPIRVWFTRHAAGALDRHVGMLRWMALFGLAAEDQELARAAATLAQHLAEPAQRVPNHPYVLGLAQLSFETALDRIPNANPIDPDPSRPG